MNLRTFLCRCAIAFALVVGCQAVAPGRAEAGITGSYINDIVVANFNSEPSAAQRCPSGYTTDGTDANKGARGQYIYLCVRHGTSQWISAIWTVAVNDLNDSCPTGFHTQRYARWGDRRNLGSGDLNDGAGGKFVWLCIQWEGLGAPIKALDVVPKNGGDFLCEVEKGSDWLPAGRGGPLGFPTDLNAGSTPDWELHDYIHLCYRDLSEDYDDEEVAFCGGENEIPCPPFHDMRLLNGNVSSPGCDRGLEVEDGVCQNDTRYQNAAWNWRYNWAYWALRNQRRDLAGKVPIDRVMWLGAHNAFNNKSDRYNISPNQQYSISDMLIAGIRAIDLDVHEPGVAPRRVVLAHGVPSVTERFYANAIKEIAYFLRKPENRREVVLLVLEDGDLSDSDDDRINDPIDVFLDRPDIGVFTPADYRALSERLSLHTELPVERLPSQAEMLRLGKRVLVLSQKRTYGGKFVFQKGSPGIPRVTYFYPGKNDWALGSEGSCTIGGDSRHAEDPYLTEIYESRIIAEKANTIDALDLADLVRCNVNIINLDQILNPNGSSFAGIRTADGEPVGRLASAVWSWDANAWGGVGRTVAILQRPADPAVRWGWNATLPTTRARFACRFNTDFRTDAQWKITTADGVWADGFETCRQEFPGSVFHVPVNAYQNELLIAQMQAHNVSAVLLNYTDAATDSQGEESTWVIAESDDTPPVIRPVLEGQLGNDDWYGSSVTYRWVIDDLESSVTSTSGCAPGVVYGDTPGTTIRCTARSRGGEASESATFKVDMTPPGVTWTKSPQANSHFWHRTPVRFTFTCTDNASGVAACPEPIAFTGEGLAQRRTVEATDRAGNLGFTQIDGVSIDFTPPQTTVTATIETLAQPYTFGTHSPNPVRFVMAASDALSGVADLSYEVSGAGGLGMIDSLGRRTLYFSNIGESIVKVWATDRAGNVELAQTYVVRVGAWGSLPVGTCGTPANVVAQPGGFRLDRATGEFVQTVTITNTTGQAQSAGWLVLDGLSANATLRSPAGHTACAAPPEAPYVGVPLGADGVWLPNETVSVTLRFANPTRAGITYTPRVVVGARP
jgi:hypothetical protein